jgi:hypothetical protein
MFIILVFSAFLFGAIFFTRTPDARTVRRLKVSAAVTFAALLLLMISGIIPDIGFGNVPSFSGTTHNAYGTFRSSVDATGLGNFTGPLLFDMMEHVSLIVPGLAAIAGVLIFTAGDKVITVPAIRTSVLTLMAVTGIWAAAAAFAAGIVYLWGEAAFRLLFTYYPGFDADWVLWNGRVGDIAAMWLTISGIAAITGTGLYLAWRHRERVGSVTAWMIVLIGSAIAAPMIGEIGNTAGSYTTGAGSAQDVAIIAYTLLGLVVIAAAAAFARLRPRR